MARQPGFLTRGLTARTCGGRGQVAIESGVMSKSLLFESKLRQRAGYFDSPICRRTILRSYQERSCRKACSNARQCGWLLVLRHPRLRLLRPLGGGPEVLGQADDLNVPCSCNAQSRRRVERAYGKKNTH